MTSPFQAEETEDILFSQYYEVAVCTILFYDHLLTLADEVRQDFTSSVLRLHTEITT